MPSTRSRGEPLTPFDLESFRILCRKKNQGVPIVPIGGGLGGGERMQPPREVNENNQVQPNKRVGEALNPKDPQGKRLNDNERVNINIMESDGPLVLPPLPQRIHLW